MRDGGLKKEALELLRHVWRFDYMGAAEFEFGDVPRALSALANSELVATTIQIPYKEITNPFKYRKGKDKLVLPKGSHPVHVICPKGDEAAVERVIRRVAAGKQFLKEHTRFEYSVLEPKDDYHQSVGWLVLEKPFLFFIDQEMFEKARKLFVEREE